MKLYYAPGACSLSPHIVARAAKLPVEISKVSFDGATRTTAEGENFFEVNPRGGYVPALRRDDDSVLLEGVAIVQYLADQAPDAHLMPEHGSRAYYDVLSWLIFISSELHKGFSPLFRPDTTDQEKEVIADKLKSRYAVVNDALGAAEYLGGDAMSVADAYAYTILRWSPMANIDVSTYPNIQAFVQRMESHEGVQAALQEEGLDPIAA